VICKSKSEQGSLLSFYLLGKDIVFDLKRVVLNRKKYVCFQDECLGKLPIWVSRHLKKSSTLRQRQVA